MRTIRISPTPLFLTIAMITIHIFNVSKYRHALKELDDWSQNATRNIVHYIDLEVKNVPTTFCQYPTTLLIMVHSKPRSITARNAIRTTWGNPALLKTHNTSLFFLLGRDALRSHQMTLEAESSLYKDIILENFTDNYSMLTLKSVSMLKLFQFGTNCKYLLKADEDLFVNVASLVRMLKRKGRDLLWGRAVLKERRKNDYYKSWYAPRYMYMRHEYPTFLAGPAYVMSQDVAIRLFQEVLQVPLFHLEDVFVTGILAEKAGVYRLHSKLFTDYRMPEVKCTFLKLYTMHSFTAAELIEVYKVFEKLPARCVKH